MRHCVLSKKRNDCFKILTFWSYLFQHIYPRGRKKKNPQLYFCLHPPLKRRNSIFHATHYHHQKRTSKIWRLVASVFLKTQNLLLAEKEDFVKKKHAFGFARFLSTPRVKERTPMAAIQN